MQRRMILIGIVITTVLIQGWVPQWAAPAASNSDVSISDASEAGGDPAPRNRQRSCANVSVLYVVEFSHADVGFRAPPSAMQQRNYERTLAALDLADLYPEFHWTIETIYQLESFIDRASPAALTRLKARFAEGRFAVGANFLIPHSGLWGEEQLHRLTYPGAKLESLTGYQPATAMLNDVPGFSMAIPRIMAGSQVPFAVLGASAFFAGKPTVPLEDRPFWWEARDGSRVLSWITYTSYKEGTEVWGLDSINNMMTEIPERIQDFEQAGYPFDAILVCRADDDAFPTSQMTDLAREWNVSPTPPVEIKLATARQFFEHLLNAYGDAFPVYRGDASGHWEDACMLTPASVGKVRRARTNLPVLEALWALFAGPAAVDYPARELNRAWELAMILDEHSNGGFGWPLTSTASEIQRKNKEFVAVAESCENITERLEQRGLAATGPLCVPAGESGLVLFNPLGQDFSGVVEVECGYPQPADLRLVDPAGGPDPMFRWTTADRAALAIEVSVPARGWRRWRITGGGCTPPPPQWQPAHSVTAGDHCLTLDPATGVATSLTQLSSGFDWLAQAGPHHFAGIEFSRQKEVDFGKWQHHNPSPVKILAEDSGALFRRIRVVGRAEKVGREYRLYEAERRIDVRIAYWRPALPEVPGINTHWYAVSFPANLVVPTTLTIDGPDGWYQPATQSLPDHALGHFAASTGACLSGVQKRWMAISSLDSPILDLGEMNAVAQPSIETDEVALTWKLIRHGDYALVWPWNFAPIEAEPGLPGMVPYSFCIRLGDASNLPPGREILRHDLAPPLAAWVANGSVCPNVPAKATSIDIKGPVQLICLKRSEEDHGLILRLRAGHDGGDALITPPVPPSRAWLTNLVEQPQTELTISGGAVHVPLVADGIVTVLLEY